MITAPIATLLVGLVGIAGVLATLLQRSEPTITASEIAILRAVAAQRETRNNGEDQPGGAR